MLTNVYYYNFYRPYIMGSRNQIQDTSKRARIAVQRSQNAMNPDMQYVLNKSLSSEIVHYAQNVSFGVTGFRTAVRRLLQDMGSYNRNALYEGQEATRDQLERQLAAVSELYNANTAFLRQQQHSPSLRTLSFELGDNVYYNRSELGRLGFVLSQDQTVHFDAEAFRQLNHNEVRDAIGESRPVFNSLYQRTGEILSAPLSQHMQFRGLSYHYNYQVGRMVEDGFSIIESGMLIDRYL